MSISTTPSRFARTLTVGASPVTLLSLIQAINANFSGQVSELTIQASDGNGANNIFVGDLNVSTTDYGVKLPAGASYTERSVRGNNIALDSVYVVASAAAQKINVTARVL